MTDTVDATFYIQLEPEKHHYWTDASDPRAIKGARATRMTQKRPDKPIGGTVLVKLTVRVPVGVFMPLRPEAVVVIPADFTEPMPIMVEAGDPHDYEDEDQE